MDKHIKEIPWGPFTILVQWDYDYYSGVGDLYGTFTNKMPSTEYFVDRRNGWMMGPWRDGFYEDDEVNYDPYSLDEYHDDYFDFSHEEETIEGTIQCEYIYRPILRDFLRRYGFQEYKFWVPEWQLDHEEYGEAWRAEHLEAGESLEEWYAKKIEETYHRHMNMGHTWSPMYCIASVKIGDITIGTDGLYGIECDQDDEYAATAEADVIANAKHNADLKYLEKLHHTISEGAMHLIRERRREMESKRPTG